MIIKLVYKNNGKIAIVNRFEVMQCKVDYIRNTIYYTKISQLTDDYNRKVGEMIKYERLETYADEIYIDNERIEFS